MHNTNNKNTQLDHQQHKAEPNPRQQPFCLLAHDLQDARNVGSLFRLADAFAIDKIYLSGNSPAPPDAKIRKTARHTETTVPFVYTTGVMDIIKPLKQKHYLFISLEITSRSIDISRLQLPENRPVCLIVGAENTGIEQSLLDNSDITVHIPMLGKNSSMNVAGATAIALYEINRQLQQVLPNS